jgi:SulP family sulfate permease
VQTYRRLPSITQLLPFLAWLPIVNSKTLRADAIAGLVGAIIVLPQGVAFATLAGMPPEYGLYAAVVPAVIAALFGSSFHLVSGPTNAMSVLLFAQISPIAEPGSAQYIQIALTVTFLTGAMQLGLGLARLGMLVNFVSHSVVIGFTAAAGLMILASQLRNFFGMSLPHGGSFFETVQVFGEGLVRGEINLAVTAVGTFTIVLALATRRVYPRIPYMVVAAFGGSIFAALLRYFLGERFGAVPTIGALPGALPPMSAPSFTLGSIRQSLPIALGMTILGLTEALSIARAVAVRAGQRIDSNQEFVGQGLSNLCGAFFSAYPSSGSFNRTGANFEAGALTPLATVFASGMLMLIVLMIAPLAAHLPIAVMAAILFLVGYALIDYRHILHIERTSQREGAVLLATCLTGLLVDLEFAIIAGVLGSFVVYLQRTSRPKILDVKPDPGEGSYHFTADSDLPDCPQIKMIRVNGSLYFGAVDHVARSMASIGAAGTPQKHLVIAASGINFIDVAGAEMLAAEAQRRRAIGGGLYFYRLKDEVRDLLERGGYLKAIGPENMFAVKDRVIANIYPKIDTQICRNCPVRIFSECQQYLPNGERRSPDASAAQQ